MLCGKDTTVRNKRKKLLIIRNSRSLMTSNNPDSTTFLPFGILWEVAVTSTVARDEAIDFFAHETYEGHSHQKRERLQQRSCSGDLQVGIVTVKQSLVGEGMEVAISIPQGIGISRESLHLRCFLVDDLGRRQFGKQGDDPATESTSLIIKHNQSRHRKPFARMYWLTTFHLNFFLLPVLQSVKTGDPV